MSLENNNYSQDIQKEEVKKTEGKEPNKKPEQNHEDILPAGIKSDLESLKKLLDNPDIEPASLLKKINSTKNDIEGMASLHQKPEWLNPVNQLLQDYLPIIKNKIEEGFEKIEIKISYFDKKENLQSAYKAFEDSIRLVDNAPAQLKEHTLQLYNAKFEKYENKIIAFIKLFKPTSVSQTDLETFQNTIKFFKMYIPQESNLRKKVDQQFPE